MTPYWGNIDDDRVPKIKLTYKDGRTLLLDVKDVPLQTAANTGIRKGQTRAIRQLMYERRSDGLIYPVRGEEKWRYISYTDADNIMSLRAGLHATINELKVGFTLIQITGIFASEIAGLGGIAALNHSFNSGGLFEPVPRKGKSRVNADNPSSETAVGSGKKKTPGADPKAPAPSPRSLTRASTTDIAELQNEAVSGGRKELMLTAERGEFIAILVQAKRLL